MKRAKLNRRTAVSPGTSRMASDEGASWVRSGDDDFLQSLSVQTGGQRYHGAAIEALPTGREFYAAELDAIRRARRSVTLEAYIFHKGRIGHEFRDALCERARTGVQVRVLVDAMGNWHVNRGFFRPLEQCGGKMAFFRSLPRLPWLNWRTHREIIVVDGHRAFIGGAGIDDQWLHPLDDGRPPWRDSMFAITGDAVPRIQSVFARSWLEEKEEIIAGPDFFDLAPVQEGAPGLVVDSEPQSGQATSARVVYEALVTRCRESLCINTPYFVPDENFLEHLCAAAQRGVRVRMVLPGGNSDHALTRAAARLCYPRLLDAGVEVHEYQPTMIHSKTFVVDGTWSVVGSVNLDQRSQLWNEEILLVSASRPLARRLCEVFDEDVANSKRIHDNDLARWRIPDFLPGLFARLLWTQL